MIENIWIACGVSFGNYHLDSLRHFFKKSLWKRQLALDSLEGLIYYIGREGKTMTIQMKKDEFDGALRIHSDHPLELQSSVTVTNLKGETVQRFIVSRQSEFRGEYTYNFAKDRQAWLEKEAEKREARRG